MVKTIFDNLLRVVGSDQRLLEDRLRLLRGLRFAARFELTPTAATAAALYQGQCQGVSQSAFGMNGKKHSSKTAVVLGGI